MEARRQYLDLLDLPTLIEDSALHYSRQIRMAAAHDICGSH